MKSYHKSEIVIEELGDKFLAALGEAVAGTRHDLAEYRSTFPRFVADSSPRGLANWIHDRLWSHLVTQLGGLADIRVQEKGVTREVFVGTRYRLRFKRHHKHAEVSTYLTQMALEFLGQPSGPATLPGLEGVHLIAGYTWMEESHEIGAAVLSCRDGKDNVLWIKEFPEQATADRAVALPDRSLPPRPAIQVRDTIDSVEVSEADDG